MYGHSARTTQAVGKELLANPLPNAIDGFGACNSKRSRKRALVPILDTQHEEPKTCTKGRLTTPTCLSRTSGIGQPKTICERCTSGGPTHWVARPPGLGKSAETPS